MYPITERKGLSSDIRKMIYTAVDKIGYDQLKAFHAADIANKPYTYCIVASSDKLKDADMEKYGELKKLSLEEIFGY